MINPRVPNEAAPAEPRRMYQAPRAQVTRQPANPERTPVSSPRGPAAPAPATRPRATATPPTTPSTRTAAARRTSGTRRPRSTSSPRRAAEESEAGAGPSGLQAPVPQEERRLQKRRRSIQRTIDNQVMQEAETEAKLEESMMDEEIVARETQVFENRRENIRLEMGMASARKKLILQKLADKVESALDRLAFAMDSLQKNSARKIQQIEDKYSREKAANERELQYIATEEEAKIDSHRLRRRDRMDFHARDFNRAEEDLVAGIQQASENEDLLSDDEAYQDEEDAEDNKGEVDDDPQDN